MACGILIPWPEIEPMPPAVEVWSLDHWTTKEVLSALYSCHPVAFGSLVSDEKLTVNLREDPLLRADASSAFAAFKLLFGF